MGSQNLDYWTRKSGATKLFFFKIFKIKNVVSEGDIPNRRKWGHLHIHLNKKPYKWSGVSRLNE